ASVFVAWRRGDQARGRTTRRGQLFVVVVIRRRVEFVGRVFHGGNHGNLTRVRGPIDAGFSSGTVNGTGQRQLQIQVGQRLELGERRQVLDGLEREVVEELGGRAQQLRMPGHVAMSD